METLILWEDCSKLGKQGIQDGIMNRNMGIGLIISFLSKPKWCFTEEAETSRVMPADKSHAFR